MEMYEHYLRYGHLEFLFWGYRDKKENNLLLFNQWIELLINQKYLWIYFGKKRKKERKEKKEIELKLSYNFYIKKVCLTSYIDFLDGFLLVLKYLNFCATQVSYTSFWCLGQIHRK